MSFGSRLKELRKAQGFTQETLAEALGVTKGAIGNYEIDANSPKEEVLIKIFKTLNAEPNYFFQDSFSDIGNMLTIEQQDLIKKYASLDEHGKEAVNSILNIELKRIQHETDTLSCVGKVLN